jgi:hypothetical protein
MSDHFLKFETEPGHYICVSTLTKDVLDSLGVDGLGDDYGFFVYEAIGDKTRSRCSNVLAKCPSFEAASRLIELYSVIGHTAF